MNSTYWPVGFVCNTRSKHNLTSVLAVTVQPQFGSGGLGVLKSAQQANEYGINIRNRTLEKPAVQTQINSSLAYIVEDPAKAVTRMDPRPYEAAPSVCSKTSHWLAHLSHQCAR
jgi:hypothetical protein